MPSPVTLIYNPNSGPGAPVEEPSWLEEVRAYVRVETGVDLTVSPVYTLEEAEEAAKDAAKSGCSLVLAAGGDGTLRAAAEGLCGTGVAMGLLPRGTVNVFARELEIPLDNITSALDIAFHGETRQMDAGQVTMPDGGRLGFVLMASVGVDAAAVENVNTDLKGMVGASAYAVSGLTALATFEPPTMRISTGKDNVLAFEGKAFMVVIANTRSYGGDFKIAPEALLDDGQLDICIFKAPALPAPLQRAAFLRQVAAVTMGLHRQDPDFLYLRAAQVRVESDPETTTQRDGDSLGVTPLIAEVNPKAITVRVPKSDMVSRP